MRRLSHGAAYTRSQRASRRRADSQSTAAEREGWSSGAQASRQSSSTGIPMTSQARRATRR